jgi:DNA-binding GntR family transcriptional regulator
MMPGQEDDLLDLKRLDADPPLSSRVHQQLEALIVGRAIKPGARVVEGELARRIGVSRGPVREALQMLSRDGFIDLRPRQGAFVHVPTMKEIDDFFTVRRALEVESAGLAAQCIEPEQARELRHLIDVANEILASGEDPSTNRDRTGMHAKIAEIADNPLLSRMLATLRRRSDWYSPPFDPVMRRNAWSQHRELVDAISAHDSGRARELMSAHVTDSRNHFYASVADNDISAP